MNKKLAGRNEGRRSQRDPNESERALYHFFYPLRSTGIE